MPPLHNPDAEPIPYTPVDSSWIQGLRWTPDRGAIMRVRKTGRAYDYPGLQRWRVREWLSRVSKGKWWHKNVREAAAQFSRWTGPVHPLFTHPQVDGPATFGNFSQAPLHAWLKSKLSLHTTQQHLAALFGWLPGTTLNHTYMVSDGNRTGNNNMVWSEVGDPTGHYSAQRSLTFPTHGGPPELNNESIHINDKAAHPFRGVSGPILLRQIRAAYELGIPRINFYAAWEPPDSGSMEAGRPSLAAMFPGLNWAQAVRRQTYTGGLHWPVMGADGILPEHYIKRIPREIVESAQLASRGRFLSTQQISDFFRSPEAREYYETDPTSHDGFIDTTPGSYSRRMIEQHVAKNALRHGNAAPIPDNMMPKKPLHLGRRPRPRYPFHIEHLLATGELHPRFFDAYFDR